AQVAAPIQRRGVAGVEGPPTQRPATRARPCGAGRGRGVGVRAAGRAPCAAVTVELSGDRPGTGRPLSGERLRLPIGLLGAPLAGRRRAQALAAPVLDLDP